MTPNTTFSISDMVSVNGTTVTGKVLSTIVGYVINNAGSGFTAGQIFNINTANGKGASFKVNSTATGGAILSLTMLTFGYGYLTDFYATIYPESTIIGSPGYYSDFTNGFVEDGFIADSSGNVKQTFTDITTVKSGNYYNSENSANITMVIGAVANYPGYYSSPDGFLDDVVVLQDGILYQDFSYVISSSIPVIQYRNPVQKLVHPAGTKMFGEFTITNDLDLSVDVEIEENSTTIHIEDDVIVLDSILLSNNEIYSDAVINSDNGSISLVNYVDISYVDITYVGTLTLF